MKVNPLTSILLAVVLVCGPVGSASALTHAEQVLVEEPAAKRADKELNGAYGRLISQLKPEERKALTSAEIAWIKYRDLLASVKASHLPTSGEAEEAYRASLVQSLNQRAADLRQMQDVASRLTVMRSAAAVADADVEQAYERALTASPTEETLSSAFQAWKAFRDAESHFMALRLGDADPSGDAYRLSRSELNGKALSELATLASVGGPVPAAAPSAASETTASTPVSEAGRADNSTPAPEMTEAEKEQLAKEQAKLARGLQAAYWDGDVVPLSANLRGYLMVRLGEAEAGWIKRSEGYRSDWAKEQPSRCFDGQHLNAFGKRRSAMILGSRLYSYQMFMYHPDTRESGLLEQLFAAFTQSKDEPEDYELLRPKTAFKGFLPLEYDGISNLIYNTAYISSIPAKVVHSTWDAIVMCGVAVLAGQAPATIDIMVGVLIAYLQMILGFVMAVLMLVFGTVLGTIAHPFQTLSNLTGIFDLIGAVLKPLVNIIFWRW